jgi:hypothetical protein
VTTLLLVTFFVAVGTIIAGVIRFPYGLIMGMSAAVLGVSAYANDAGIHDDIIGLWPVLSSALFWGSVWSWCVRSSGARVEISAGLLVMSFSPRGTSLTAATLAASP